MVDKPETLRAQMELDRKTRDEAQSIIHSYSMTYVTEGDAYERTGLNFKRRIKMTEKEKVNATNAAHISLGY